MSQPTSTPDSETAIEAKVPSRGRLLLVDDEPLLLRGLSRNFERAGFRADTAGNGSAAKELLSTQAYDAVISDISMPAMGGIELLRLVHQIDEDLPVVLMTGGPSVQTAVQALEYGAVRYLIKPFDFSELLTAVEYAVRLRRLASIKRQALSLLGADATMVDASLVAGFNRALESLWMAYQPIVHSQGQRVFGYEALVRTREPSFPNPGVLLDAAERLRRVHDVGRAVRASVAHTLADAPHELDLFINLHSQDLSDDTLYDAASPLSAFAKRVVLEVTERASLDDVKDVRARIASLRRMGYRIAVDDLGAGYAGLTSFVLLEPEVVKLDMSLIRDVDKQPTRRKLVQSMSLLCRDLGMLVVAEGIETPAERDTVVELGCDLLQGYLYAKPGPPFPTVKW